MLHLWHVARDLNLRRFDRIGAGRYGSMNMVAVDRLFVPSLVRLKSRLVALM